MSRSSLFDATVILTCLLLSSEVGRADSSPDFDLDVLPILTKSGCNSGACHGAAAGRGEFRLSLFGSRPDDDFRAITMQLEGRRVNPVHPERSLLLLKPTGGVDHEGGTRFAENSPEAATLRRWIDAAASRTTDSGVIDMRVEPALLVVPIGASENFSVQGILKNGSTRDLTQQLKLTTDDSQSVTVSASGTVTSHRAGRHLLIARYPGHVVPIEVFTPFPGDRIDPINPIDPMSPIDRRIDERLQLMNLIPAAAADDTAFLCRATLELTGRRPAVSRIRSFSADESPDKRSRLIDELLESPEFTDYWTYLFARMLRVHDARSEQAATEWHAWLREQIAAESPFNELAAEMVNADGNPEDNGPAAFHTVTGDARSQAEHFSESLLGIRLRCANCHDHPLDRWTQDDYHGLAAIFATVDRGALIRPKPNGTAVHPATGERAVPRILLSHSIVTADEGRRKLADWISDPGNPLFPRFVVNQVWRNLHGRGLIEPADDIRVTNPATHPQLLTELTQSFVDSGFRLKPLVRSICRTSAWSRRSLGNSGNHPAAVFLAHRVPKPLSPEVLLDSIGDVTGIRQSFDGLPDSVRLISISRFPSRVAALEALGRCPAKGTFAGSEQKSESLPLALHLINGDLLNERLTPDSPLVRSLLNSGADDTTLIDDIYLLILSRFPTELERSVWLSELESARQSGATASTVIDLCWALLAGEEFLTCP